MPINPRAEATLILVLVGFGILNKGLDSTALACQIVGLDYIMSLFFAWDA